MEVTLKTKELTELYTTGKSKRNWIPQDIAQKFVRRVIQIQAAENIYDLWNIKSFNFERMQGTKNQFSIRISLKWRSRMTIDFEDEEKTRGAVLVEDISPHYND
jgi:plasmid maintenance system killer protein